MHNDHQTAAGSPAAHDLAAVRRDAVALAAAAAPAGWPDDVRALLEWGVARPLAPDTDRAADPAATGPAEAESLLRDLTARVTALWAAGATSPADPVDGPPGADLALAVASLHSACRLLAVRAGEWEERRTWLAGLAEGRANGPTVTVVPGGPLVVSGGAELTDHLGCQVDAGPVAVLCRCGRSAAKPGCDTTCLAAGFDDAKDPSRVPDRQDRYVGQQATVLDNRGVCQHSGLCTDRLAGVFHADSEPFVTPSGGRLDEIIRAVRDCPSGALGYAIDGIEARTQTDWGGSRPPAVQVTKDGPYRLTGSVALTGGPGEGLPGPGEGASTEHYALCRCGNSRNKPFCSGRHWEIDFRDPVPDPDRTPSIFEWAGGLPALTRMTRIFYERHVPGDELLGPLFAAMSADHPERVAAWLGEVFGGPANYSEQHGGYSHMLGEHRGRCLTEEQRARWVELLMRSARDAGLPNDPEFRAAFGSYIEWGSRLAFENSQTGARPPENMPMPHWDWNTAAGPPSGRISALAPVAEEASPGDPDAGLALPAQGEPVGFEAHVRQLFRERDRGSMLFAFDLWKYEDVRTHAHEILARVRAGTMPCDTRWSPERVALFARWAEAGTPQ